MGKIYPTRPFFLMFYGYPGSGKTYFARQLCENINAAHLQADKIRQELFEQPRYDKQENDVVTHIMDYMAEEFLAAGLSVAYHVNAMRGKQRQHLAKMAHKYGAKPLLIWFQMDQDTAFFRNTKRDKRKADDKYASSWDRTTFEDLIKRMQNPKASEDYVVVSGKHLFNTQQSAVVSKLRRVGVLSGDDANSRVIKPGLVNLVPSQSRGPLGRRDIRIR